MSKKIRGKIYRQVENRRTLNFSLNNKSYFIKLHLGVGWREIIKNYLQLRKPIFGAENEWLGVNKLQQLGVDTMNVVAYGMRGSNPATIESFIITEDLQGTVSLEDYCKAWEKQKPDFILKKNLIEKIATVSKVLHENGVCHRDFYICHFLMHTNSLDASNNPKLSLIDLHRSIIKKNLSTRWKRKDLAGLYFSAMDIGLTRRDLYRYIKIYYGTDLRSIFEASTQKNEFMSKVSAQAHSMYERLKDKVDN